ncbi:dTMP kinase [Psychrobacter fjordensis]|uniref:dTMP kinase n=1 Tax=Psychrobacter fjordensis TaxID=664424 RepID=UPI0019181C25|nr:hypothetical protein [Psychrobacter fjordensis]
MNNSGIGKLIVIEGGDGLGKSTQYSLIEDMLTKKGYEVSTYDFPHKAGNPLSDLIGDFLNGKHGQVEPEFLSLAFAADRYISKDTLNGSLKSGAIVLCDRYILSNIAFQTSKLTDIDRSEKLVDLIQWLEYEVYKLPKPDVEIIITAPDSHYIDGVHLERSGSKDRSYSLDSSDIHEKDENLQVKVNSFFSSVENKKNRMFIEAYDEYNNRKSIQNIYNEITPFIKKILEE